VELAGALAEIAHHSLTHDFRHIDPAATRVILLEAGPRILPTYHPSLSRRAEDKLADLGVEVMCNSMVTCIDDEGLIANSERLPARTVLWAAGVLASPLGARLGAPIDRAGRVEVGPDLSIQGNPQVFVIGDLALVRGPDGAPVPG